jgi:hypothetical protein
MIPIYISECNDWSDGDDYHEEDHNYYYDTHYFYISNKLDYKCICCWYINDIEKNMCGIVEYTNPQHCEEYEIAQQTKQIGFIKEEEAKRLLERELENMKLLVKPNWKLCGIIEEFIKTIEIKELVIENVECDEYIVPYGITFVSIITCKIIHLILSDTVENLYSNPAIIKKITLNSNIINIRVSDCKVEEIKIKEPLNNLHILDLHNNNLTKFNIELPETLNELDLSFNQIKDIPVKIPFKTHLFIRGNKDIKLKYLDFIFLDKKIRYKGC